MQNHEIIDIHTHTFPDAIAKETVCSLEGRSHTHSFSDGTVEGLSSAIKEAGVSLAVVQPVVTNPLKTEKINRAAAEVNEHTEETHVFSFGGMHPDTPNYKEELRLIQELGLKGFKLHPAYQSVTFDDIRYQRIVGYAEELGLITLVHGGVDIGIPGEWASPRQTRILYEAVKPKKLIVAHLGGWQLWEEVKDWLADTELLFDTAFTLGDIAYFDDFPKESRVKQLSKEKFAELVRLLGAERVLFGTDSPWAEHKEQVKRIESCPLSDEEKALILGGNAKKLLNL